MNPTPTHIFNVTTVKRQTPNSKKHKAILSCISLAAYLLCVTGLCWISSMLITKETVIAIGLIIGFLVVSVVLKFALSLILTIAKWILIVAVVIVVLALVF